MIAKTVLSRLGATIASLFIVTLGVSLLIELMPGDPAAIAAGEFATPEVVERVRGELGLNEPVIERYFSYLGDILLGDLGTSAQLQPGRPVWDLIRQTLPITLSLTGVAIAMAVLIALPIGYAAAARPNSWVDRCVTVASAVLLAVPSFVLGLLLITWFALGRNWLPALGYEPFAEGWWQWLRHLILPAFTLAAVSAAELSRQVRGAMIDTLEQDYIRAVDAKGMTRRTIIARHAFKNAATPIVTVLGLQFTRIIGGAVVIERIFAMPGLGSLAYDSVTRRDLPVMQGVVLIGALLVICTNVLVDVILAYLNPKARARA